MIRLIKQGIPEVLRQHGAAWTGVLIHHVASATVPTSAEKSRYRHPDIKAALVAETAGKCAYCESKLGHITYGDVEHIVPKSVAVEKTFEWENLTLACDICNTNKGSHFGNHDDLVDPYTTEPTDHLVFLGATVLPKLGSGAGVITTSTLRLNRSQLLERRQERLSSLCRQLQQVFDANEPGIRAVLRRDIEQHELGGDKEYAAMARAYVIEQLRAIDAQAN